jgi:beta-lactamase superfamily II metal-dependent hydrolase
MAETTVAVRMYHMGFGDSFRITVKHGDDTWRMLVDCGVHSQGAARPIAASVNNIVEDLADDCDGAPHLDVVVATHRHQDHICGFADDAWSAVHVDEVWVPFVEDLRDPDAQKLREAQSRAASKLHSLIERRRSFLRAGTKADEMLAVALDFAINSSGNARAMDRLLGANGRQFANRPVVRFLPEVDRQQNRIDVGRCGVVAHVLGPPREGAMLKQMRPPGRAGWLMLNLDDDVHSTDDVYVWPLFNSEYTVNDDDVPEYQEKTRRELRLNQVSNDVGLLTAASILERSVNNTSLFFVLDVAGVRLLFPGDSQHGGWEHVLADPESLELVKNPDFYKVGHHGSHNATPKSFVYNHWQKPGDAMVPWGLVERWKKTIPKQELLDGLADTGHRVILPQNVIETKRTSSHGLTQTEWWSELTFTASGEKGLEASP